MRAGSAGASPIMSSSSPTWTPSRRSSAASPEVRLGTYRISSAVRDHDLPEMAAPLEMPIGRLSLGERKCPIDHGAQTVQRDRPVHRLEIGAAADAYRAKRNAAAGQSNRDRAEVVALRRL